MHGPSALMEQGPADGPLFALLYDLLTIAYCLDFGTECTFLALREIES